MLPVDTKKGSKQTNKQNIYLKTSEDYEAMRTKGNKTAKKADSLKVSWGSVAVPGGICQS